jgi:hypothetical protein
MHFTEKMLSIKHHALGDPSTSKSKTNDPLAQNLTAVSTCSTPIFPITGSSAATVTPTPTAKASIRDSETHLRPWLASARSAGSIGRGPRRRRGGCPSRGRRDPRPATAGRSSTHRCPSASSCCRGWPPATSDRRPTKWRTRRPWERSASSSISS